MGYIKHHTIVVTGKINSVTTAREKAIAIFETHFREERVKGGPAGSEIISAMMYSVGNMFCSFFIAPDGSGEGYDTSWLCDQARREFLDWLDRPENFCDYVEVTFGGDDEIAGVLRKNR